MDPRAGEALTRALDAYVTGDLIVVVTELRSAVGIGRTLRLTETESQAAVLTEFLQRLEERVANLADKADIVAIARDEIARALRLN